MSDKKAYFASLVGLIGNIFLFICKISIGLMTNSLAVISDAVNSFTDIIASFAISWSVKISQQKPDKDHPFGHSRAEPIAAFVVSLFMAIAAFEILKAGVMRFFINQEVLFSKLAVGVLLLSVFVKIGMYLYLKNAARLTKSCALEATATDCINDVWASSIALVGVVGVYLNYPALDSFVAVLIAFWIGYSAYQIGSENIDYLMGRAPSQKIIEKCKKAALQVEGVKNAHDILAHYVGTIIHVEIHIEVKSSLSTQESHKIGKDVQNALLKQELIKQVFVHIDPV